MTYSKKLWRLSFGVLFDQQLIVLIFSSEIWCIVPICRLKQMHLFCGYTSALDGIFKSQVLKNHCSSEETSIFHFIYKFFTAIGSTCIVSSITQPRWVTFGFCFFFSFPDRYFLLSFFYILDFTLTSKENRFGLSFIETNM